MELERAVGTKEMALSLGCSPDWLRSCVAHGTVPAMRIGRKLSFLPSEVRAALRAEVKPEPVDELAERRRMSPRSRSARRKVA